VKKLDFGLKSEQGVKPVLILKDIPASTKIFGSFGFFLIRFVAEIFEKCPKCNY